MDDLISRKAVLSLPRNKVRSLSTYEVIEETINVTDIEHLPSAQPEINKEELKRTIRAGIVATNTKDVYSCGMRNGMRWCKALLEDDAPKFEDASLYAELEQRWIPVTERLPEDEHVLISKKPSKISGSKWCVTIAIRTADPRSGKIQWRDSGFGVIQDDEVLAWMPRPKPYQGGKQEAGVSK